MRTPKSWDDVFMDMARDVAQRSKDPSTQVGCVIADNRHQIVSVGFNGPPHRILDNTVPWDIRPAKYDWIIHAEDNALHFAKGSGSTLYVTGIPCPRCMLLISRSYIERVVYGSVTPVMCGDTAQLTVAIALAAQIQLEPYK